MKFCRFDHGVDGLRAGTVTVVVSKLERNVAYRLRVARDRAGLTQEALAGRIGIESATLSRYETGKLAIPVRVLLETSTALSVPIATFFDPPGPTKTQDNGSAELEAIWRGLNGSERDLLLGLARVVRDRRKERRRKN